MIQNTDSYIIAWRAWYDSGTKEPSTYNSVEHTLIDLPDDGFQAMRVWYSDGTGRYISGNDYYFFASAPAGLIFGQTDDPLPEIKTRYPNALIKRGKHVPDVLMKQIHTEMISSTSPVISTPISTPTL